MNPPKKQPATVRNEPADDLEEQIRLRAHELYEARGREDGHELEAPKMKSPPPDSQIRARVENASVPIRGFFHVSSTLYHHFNR